MSLSVSQALLNSQKFAPKGICIRVWVKPNGRKQLQFPCPHCYFELSKIEPHPEGAGYHRVMPPTKVENGIAVIRLECDKRKDISMAIAVDVLQRLLEREGMQWWQMKGGI